MKPKTMPRILILLLGLLLAGCQAATPVPASSNAQSENTLQIGSEATVIEGRVVPTASYNLAFTATGLVAEVLVKEGEVVTTGQELARLSGQEQAQAALKAAELELLTAQQELQGLSDGLEASQNEAFLAVQTARQTVQDAEDRLDEISNDRLQNEIAGAQAQVVITENRLKNAVDNYKEYEDEPETDVTRASYQLRLTEAQRAYDEAVRQLDNLNGDRYTFIFQQAEDALQAAHTQLDLAEKHYAEALQGVDNEAQQLAESRVVAAQANLQAAQASQEHLVLRAPGEGSLVRWNVKPGELAVAGLTVAVLADLSVWYVETVDLTEIDVVNVSVGQVVWVAADALPKEQMAGEVISISQGFLELRGDITYLTRIKLDQVDPRVRWGMTVLVTFSQP
jgi:multidrug resistance efflux pump